MRGFGRRVFSYSQYQSAVGGQHNRIDLVRLQSLAHGCPRGVDTLIEKSLLNGNQQMIGQHAKKDVRFHSPFFVVKIGLSPSGDLSVRNAASARVNRTYTRQASSALRSPRSVLSR